MKPVVSATPLKLVWGALFMLAACSVESGQIRTRVNEVPGFQTSATSRAPQRVSGVRVFNPEERTVNHIQRSLAFFPGQRANNFQTGVICGEDGIFAASAEDCEGPRDVICLSVRGRRDSRCPRTQSCSENVDPELRGLCGAVVGANLRAAYTRNLSGRGITVGVIDSGFNPYHPEFPAQGVVIGDDGEITLTFSIGNNETRTIRMDNTPTVMVEEDGTEYEFEVLPGPASGHGSSVVGLIAAPRDGGNHPYNMHGIAYNSNIIFRGISLRFAVPLNTATNLPQNLRTSDIIRNRVGAEILKDFISEGAPIVSSSASFFPPVSPATAPQGETPNRIRLSHWTRATVHEHLGAMACAIAQGMPIPQGAPAAPVGTECPVAANPPTNPTIFVWAAANQGNPSLGVNDPGKDPSVDAGLAFLYPELRTHLIAVVNVSVGDRSRRVDEFNRPGFIENGSNRCGVAADYCIGAPGSGYSTPTLGTGVFSDDYWTDERGLGYGPFAGTSASAPVVSATLALMFEAFGPGTTSNMSSLEIVQRLYLTAKKDEIYSRATMIDARYTEDTEDSGMVTNPNAGGIIYGQGLLDIGRAVNPEAPTSLRASLGRARTRLSDTARFTPDETGIFTSPALGDALSRALGSREAVFFDALDAAFPFPARSLGMVPARTRRALDSLGRRVYETEYGTAALMPFDGLGQKADGLSLTLQGRGVDMAVRYNAPLHLALAPAQDALRAFPSLTGDYFDLVREGAGVSLGMDITNRTSATATFFSGHASDAQNLRGEEAPDARGAHLAYRVQGDAYTLQLEAGYLMESDQILGIYPQGLFAHEGTTPTFFAGVAGLYEFGNWQGLFHARMGRTEPDALNATQSGLHNITRVASSSFSAGLYRRNLFAEGDGFGIIVAQPLRIEDGSAELTYATGRTRDKILLEETLKIPLTPSGRAVDIEAVYHWKRLAFSAGATLNAGHERGKTDAHISARFAKRF